MKSSTAVEIKTQSEFLSTCSGAKMVSLKSPSMFLSWSFKHFSYRAFSKPKQDLQNPLADFTLYFPELNSLLKMPQQKSNVFLELFTELGNLKAKFSKQICELSQYTKNKTPKDKPCIQRQNLDIHRVVSLHEGGGLKTSLIFLVITKETKIIIS